MKRKQDVDEFLAELETQYPELSVNLVLDIDDVDSECDDTKSENYDDYDKIYVFDMTLYRKFIEYTIHKTIMKLN